MLQRLLNWLQDREFNALTSSFTKAEAGFQRIVEREAQMQRNYNDSILDIKNDIENSQDRELRAEKWLAVIPKVGD